MAYIYKIQNKINNKIYIGKTLLTPQKRFKQHCIDAYKSRNENRPLYSAMRKYGIENFELSVVEECDDRIVNEREEYWIKYYGSFHYGYNVTLGGDGKHYLNYDLICNKYAELQNCAEVARQLNISPDSVYKVLKNRNISIKSSQEVCRQYRSKPIQMFSLDDIYIRTFSSLNEAGLFIKESQNKIGDKRGIIVGIRRAANKKQKTSYGYKWEWVN